MRNGSPLRSTASGKRTSGHPDHPSAAGRRTGADRQQGLRTQTCESDRHPAVHPGGSQALQLQIECRTGELSTCQAADDHRFHRRGSHSVCGRNHCGAGPAGQAGQKRLAVRRDRDHADHLHPGIPGGGGYRETDQRRNDPDAGGTRFSEQRHQHDLLEG